MSKDVRIKIKVVYILIALIACYGIGYGIGKLFALL